MPNMPQDPRAMALMAMIQKQMYNGRKLPNEMVPGSTVMELLNPGQTFRPPPPMENSAYRSTLPVEPPPYGYDRNTRMMGPDTMQGFKNNPPYEIDDQGEVVYETPEDKAFTDKFALEQEGMRRMKTGEVMIPPGSRIQDIMPQPTGGAPILSDTGLEEFLSPGQED